LIQLILYIAPTALLQTATPYTYNEPFPSSLLKR